MNRRGDEECTLYRNNGGDTGRGQKFLLQRREVHLSERGDKSELFRQDGGESSASTSAFFLGVGRLDSALGEVFLLAGLLVMVVAVVAAVLLVALGSLW